MDTTADACLTIAAVWPQCRPKPGRSARLVQVQVAGAHQVVGAATQLAVHLDMQRARRAALVLRTRGGKGAGQGGRVKLRTSASVPGARSPLGSSTRGGIPPARGALLPPTSNSSVSSHAAVCSTQ